MRILQRSGRCGILFALWIGSVANGLEVTPAERERAERWVAARFRGVVRPAPPAVGLRVLANHGPVQANHRGGRPLKIADKEYRRGLYCHASSNIVVRLPAPAQSFTAVAGVDSNDQTAGGRGSVTFVVSVAGKAAFRSGLMREGMPGIPLRVDLAGARELTLEVGAGGDGIACDQADWADARVELADGRELWVGELPLVTASQMPFATEPPFSFVYDGKPSGTLLPEWTLERDARKLDEQRTQHTMAWTDPRTGLRVCCVGLEYHEFPTVEWVLSFKNGGTTDTPIIESIRALDASFGGPIGTEPFLHHHTGDLCTPDSFAPHSEAIPPGAKKAIANTGGRPTQSAWPYFNLAWPDGGVIVVLSWAGQWSIEWAGAADHTVSVRGGQEITRFKLHAGEEVRSPRSVVQFYDGDWLRGQNLWRRWMVRHNLPRPGGKLVQPMASLCTGNYYPGLMSNAAQELRFLRRHLEEGVRFDAWWQDAGWYPCDKVTWPKTGTWEVDATRFPKGLREVSDFVHAQGAKSILWFEPERVHPNTWLAEQHPEWIHGGGNGGLLKLGDPACRTWLIEHIDGLLTKQGIDVYRQDFNIDPLSYWRNADAADRQGITEIRHVEGYFAYWDELRRRHPQLLIDSCASGGRRNDLETLRRAVPLLRSDYYHSPEGQQAHTYGLSLWLPYHGTGCIYSPSCDRYWIRSSMAAEFTFGPDAAGLAVVDWPLLKALLDEWRQISPYFYGDFYPLTPYSLDSDAWMAWQYHRAEAGDGCVQVFRRPGSVFRVAELRLRGLDPAQAYAVTNADTGKTQVTAGRELMAVGLAAEVAARPGAALYTYRAAARPAAAPNR